MKNHGGCPWNYYQRFFGIMIVVVIVNCEDPTLLGLTLSPVVRIIIVSVIDKAKGCTISGVRVLDMVVGTVIIMH